MWIKEIIVCCLVFNLSTSLAAGSSEAAKTQNSNRKWTDDDIKLALREIESIFKTSKRNKNFQETKNNPTDHEQVSTDSGQENKVTPPKPGDSQYKTTGPENTQKVDPSKSRIDKNGKTSNQKLRPTGPKTNSPQILQNDNPPEKQGEDGDVNKTPASTNDEITEEQRTNLMKVREKIIMSIKSNEKEIQQLSQRHRDLIESLASIDDKLGINEIEYDDDDDDGNDDGDDDEDSKDDEQPDCQGDNCPQKGMSREAQKNFQSIVNSEDPKEEDKRLSSVPSLRGYRRGSSSSSYRSRYRSRYSSSRYRNRVRVRYAYGVHPGGSIRSRVRVRAAYVHPGVRYAYGVHPGGSIRARVRYGVRHRIRVYRPYGYYHGTYYRYGSSHIYSGSEIIGLHQYRHIIAFTTVIITTYLLFYFKSN